MSSLVRRRIWPAAKRSVSASTSSATTSVTLSTMRGGRASRSSAIDDW